MKTVSAITARENIHALLNEAGESHEPIGITGDRFNGVLLSEDDWRAIQETLYLLSIPGMRESIREGMSTSVDDCSEDVEW